VRDIKLLNRGNIVRVMRGIQGDVKETKGGAAGGGEVVHACGVQKLIAAIVELVGGVTGRSTWYRG
jgi:hypothetical protein